MLSNNSLSNLCKKAKARISEEAFSELKDTLERIAERIAEESYEMSRFAERRTVMRKDVKFAVRKMFRDMI